MLPCCHPEISLVLGSAARGAPIIAYGHPLGWLLLFQVLRQCKALHKINLRGSARQKIISFSLKLKSKDAADAFEQMLKT